MSKNYYDAVIVGCGIAGCSCAYTLAVAGLKCLVLEKEKIVGDKVCGDGLSVRGVKDLSLIYMDPDILLNNGGKIIHTHFMTRDDEIADNYDYEDCFAIGISRRVLNRLVFENMLAKGPEIIFDCRVTEIDKAYPGYCINGIYYAKAVVIAAGAVSGFGLSRRYGKYMPIGMSSRIRCDLPYEDDCFYINRDSVYCKGYSWLFPVGDNLWNIGVWSPDSEVKKRIIELYFDFEKRVLSGAEYEYDRNPGAYPIGTICTDEADADLTDHKQDPSEQLYYVGDSALLASSYSGEGISFAIESGVEAAKSIVANIGD